MTATPRHAHADASPRNGSAHRHPLLNYHDRTARSAADRTNLPSDSGKQVNTPVRIATTSANTRIAISTEARLAKDWPQAQSLPLHA